MKLPDLSKIFHQSSKDHAKGHPPIPQDDAEWPEEWKTTYYKVYPRLPKMNLDDPPSPRASEGHSGPPGADFFDLVKKRQSRRNFTRTPITKSELSLLLKYSCGNIGPLRTEGRSQPRPRWSGRRLRRLAANGAGRPPGMRIWRNSLTSTASPNRWLAPYHPP